MLLGFGLIGGFNLCQGVHSLPLFSPPLKTHSSNMHDHFSPLPSSSGCPEAVKLLIGSKSDLTPEVDVAQVRVSCHAHFALQPTATHPSQSAPHY